MTNNNYKELVEEYKKVNLDISNRIVTLSLMVIAAIFVICEKYGVTTLYLTSLLSFVITIGLHLLGNICFSKHYELALDKKIKNIDFRNSKWGTASEYLYWTFIFAFIVSIVIFIIAISGSISLVNNLVNATNKTLTN